MELTIHQFWNMIQTWKEAGPIPSDMYTNAAREDLRKLENSQLLRFKEILDTYVEYANTPGLWSAACALQGGCSEEDFLYFRAWLVSQGKQSYLKALSDPDSLAPYALPLERVDASSFDHEEFLYLPSWAYRDHSDISSLENFYEDLDELPQEMLEEIRREIHYHPKIREFPSGTDALQDYLPRICAASGYQGNPAWPAAMGNRTWGCDWQISPQNQPGQTMNM